MAASVVSIEGFETSVVDETLVETVSFVSIMALLRPGVVVTVVKVGSVVMDVI